MGFFDTDWVGLSDVFNIERSCGREQRSMPGLARVANATYREALREFGLTQGRAGLLFNGKSRGSGRRWAAAGAPYHVALIITIMREYELLPDSSSPATGYRMRAANGRVRQDSWRIRTGRAPANHSLIRAWSFADLARKLSLQALRQKRRPQ
jgi:hypothetical protein